MRATFGVFVCCLALLLCGLSYMIVIGALHR